MRKSSFFLLYLTSSVLILLFLFAHSFYHEIHSGPLFEKNGELVRRLGLTDLCLFTEASYTRHLTQADLHTPFQDYPVSPEHFPSGSILMPPPMLMKRPYGNID
jgi:hypothetical protein